MKAKLTGFTYLLLFVVLAMTVRAFGQTPPMKTSSQKQGISSNTLATGRTSASPSNFRTAFDTAAPRQYPYDYNNRLFLQFDYPEEKDFCKEFLTVIIAVLIFTLTFAKRIVNFKHANGMVKFVFVTALIAFLGSIVFCYLALSTYQKAAFGAAYYNLNFRRIAADANVYMDKATWGFFGGLVVLAYLSVGVLIDPQHKPKADSAIKVE